MKKLRINLLIAAVFAMIVPALAETIVVDFESGSVPTGWTASGVTIKKDNNSQRAAMSANATLISPAIKGATSVSYKHRGSGSNKELVVDISTDGGTTWTQIGSTKVSSASAYGSSSHSITADPSAETKIRFTCKSATIYVDDINITYVLSAAEPTRNAALTLSASTGNSATLAIEKGDGEGRLLAYAPGDSFVWTPTDGTSYSGNFPKYVEDNVILASGDLDTFTISGLKPAATYTAAVFEYNGDGETRNYISSPLSTLTFTTKAVPTLTLSGAISFNNTAVNSSKTREMTLTGQYLEPASGKVTITSSSANFTFSLDGETFASTLEIPYSNSELSTSFTVKFVPTELRAYETAITVIGGGAENSVSAAGRGAERSNTEYYIAPDGNDSNDGSFEHPWLNLQKAVNAALPGDEIICRGGRYNFTQRDSSGKLTVRIKNSGTAESPITIRPYADEHPIFDFEQQLLDCNRDRSKVGDRGILLTGNYWILYGLHITHAADNGIKLEGSHNRIERCEFSYCLDTGLQLGFGHNFADSGFGSQNDGSYCAYNDIVDCDSHHNCDFDTNYGSDADGFACKMHNGIGNRFIRCRAWRNGDDAWDLYETDFSVVLAECWAWESGKAEDHTWVYEYFDKGPSFSGNGNGIKLGGNGTGGSSKGVHYAYNCVAFGCNKTGSVKGFDCNSHQGGHVLIGCLAFDNGYDFMFESGGGANSEFHNNVCFGRQEILVGTESHNALLGMTPQAGKTFFNNVVTNFDRSDYVSLSEADALAPRLEDGSLPTKFARLRSGSKLVDAGIHKENPHVNDFSFLQQDVYGDARDLGPYELQEGDKNTGVQLIMTSDKTDSFRLLSSSIGGEILAEVSVEKPCAAELTIVDMAGRIVFSRSLGHVESGAVYTFPINTSDLEGGIYLATLCLPSRILTQKFLNR